MSLKGLKDWHCDMVMDEVIFEMTRHEIYEKYCELGRVTDIASVHRVMGDPLAKAYRDDLRKRKESNALKQRAAADKLVQDAMPDVAMEMIRLSKEARSEAVRAKAGRDILWMGGMKPTDESGVAREVPHLAVYDKKAKTGTEESND